MIERVSGWVRGLCKLDSDIQPSPSSFLRTLFSILILVEITYACLRYFSSSFFYHIIILKRVLFEFILYCIILYSLRYRVYGPIPSSQHCVFIESIFLCYNYTGYNVSKFHHEPHAIKTNAPDHVVNEITR